MQNRNILVINESRYFEIYEIIIDGFFLNFLLVLLSYKKKKKKDTILMNEIDNVFYLFKILTFSLSFMTNCFLEFSFIDKRSEH